MTMPIICTVEEFVRIWQSCNSVKEVSDRTRLEERSITHRAWRLRKMGVKLKNMPRRPGSGRKRRIDVAALNKIIENGTEQALEAP